MGPCMSFGNLISRGPKFSFPKAQFLWRNNYRKSINYTNFIKCKGYRVDSADTGFQGRGSLQHHHHLHHHPMYHHDHQATPNAEFSQDFWIHSDYGANNGSLPGMQWFGSTEYILKWRHAFSRSFTSRLPKSYLKVVTKSSTSRNLTSFVNDQSVLVMRVILCRKVPFTA